MRRSINAFISASPSAKTLLSLLAPAPPLNPSNRAWSGLAKLRMYLMLCILFREIASQLFEGPLERSSAAKSKPEFIAAAPSRSFQLELAAGCPTASACFSDKRNNCNPSAVPLASVLGTLVSFVVCRGPAVEQSQRPPDAQPRSDYQVKKG